MHKFGFKLRTRGGMTLPNWVSTFDKSRCEAMIFQPPLQVRIRLASDCTSA